MTLIDRATFECNKSLQRIGEIIDNHSDGSVLRESLTISSIGHATWCAQALYENGYEQPSTINYCDESIVFDWFDKIGCYCSIDFYNDGNIIYLHRLFEIPYIEELSAEQLNELIKNDCLRVKKNYE